jgi:hypothetical protein
MAKICKITDGTDSIDLLTTHWLIETGGVSMSPLTDAHIVGDDPVAGKTMVISYRLATSGATHDDLKDTASTLFALLRKAAQYHRTNWQLDPVWIEEQARTETNSRKALVLRAMELDRQSMMIKPADYIHYLVNVGLSLELEFPWSPDQPASLPTALTLTKSDGPANATQVHLANFRDDVAITHFKQYDDSGTSWTDLSAGDTLFPDAVGTDDLLIWGSTDQPLKHIVIPKLGTVGNLTTTTLQLSASIAGPGWTVLVLGTDYTCYPGATLKECLEQNDEDIVISINPIATHAKIDQDTVTAYWIELKEVNGGADYATNPVQHATQDSYAQASNYLEVAAAQLKGDHPVRALIRLRCPAGGAAAAGLGTPSRFIMGARSLYLGANEFEPWLNAGNQDNPAGWAVTYDADTTSVARQNAPGGYEAVTTFVADTSWLPRCIFTGTNKLEYFRGKFEVFVLYWQDGGATGDINIRVSFIIGADTTTSPQRSTDEVASLMGDRWTVASLGEMELPFGEITGADELEEDLIIKVLAELTEGAADINWGGVFLCPIDEWSGGLDDPLTDIVNGSSALRGATSIDFDNGILARRAQKFLVQSDEDLIPGENWNYTGSLPSIEPSRQTRVYVLQLRYDTDWGVEPLIAEPGMHMTAEVFTHPGYILLRGDD